MSLVLLQIHIFCCRDGVALDLMHQTLKEELCVSDDINITNVKSISNVSNQCNFVQLMSKTS